MIVLCKVLGRCCNDCAMQGTRLGGVVTVLC